MTPLMHAARLGDAGTVEVLLRAGASTTLTNHQGHTAARVAQDAGFPAIAATITQWAAQGRVTTILPPVCYFHYMPPSPYKLLSLSSSLLPPQCSPHSVIIITSETIIVFTTTTTIIFIIASIAAITIVTGYHYFCNL